MTGSTGRPKCKRAALRLPGASPSHPDPLGDLCPVAGCEFQIGLPRSFPRRRCRSSASSRVAPVLGSELTLRSLGFGVRGCPLLRPPAPQFLSARGPCA
jgi:hypothetical protein